MQITCGYCGALIDLSNTENNKCPNCGASFESNEEWKRLQFCKEQIYRENLEQERLKTEEQKLIVEKQQRNKQYEEKSNKIVKWGCLFPAIAVPATIIALTIVAFVAAQVGAFHLEDYETETTTTTTTVATTTTEPSDEGQMFAFDEKKQTVKFGEKATFQRAEVKVNKAEVYTGAMSSPPKGTQFVRVNFVITNTDSEPIRTFNQMYATYKVDGVEVEADFGKVHWQDDDTMFEYEKTIKQGLSYQAWQYFVIPENTGFTIHCGDNNLDIVIKASNIEK